MSGSGIGSAERRTVAEVLRDERPTTGRAVELAASTADAVAALHAVGRAHGRLDADSLLVAEDGRVAVMGALAPRIGAAAPTELRSADLRAVGRVLAAGLGWPDAAALPAPVEQLVDRAERSDAPASAMAFALRRLARDPAALVALLPPASRSVEQRPPGLAALVGLVVPNGDRRTITVAATVLVGAAAIGTGLLLVGTPGSAGTPPQAVEAAVVAPEPTSSPPAPDRIEAAEPVPSSIRALLRPARDAGTSPVVERRQVQAARAAADPVPTGSAVPASRTAPSSPRPSSSAPASAPASAEPTPPPATPPSSSPAPAPSAPTAPSSAPSAPAASTPPSVAPAPPRATPPPVAPVTTPKPATPTGSPKAG